MAVYNSTDFELKVSLPFSLVIKSDNVGNLRQTNTAEFLLNCVAYDESLAQTDEQTPVYVAGTGDSTGTSVVEDDPVIGPEDDEDEAVGEVDLGGLFPFPIPLPPEDPELPLYSKIPFQRFFLLWVSLHSFSENIESKFSRRRICTIVSKSDKKASLPF